MSAVYTQEPVDKIPEFIHRTNEKMYNISITNNDVIKELKYLNIYKARELETIHPKPLKALTRDRLRQ